MEYENAVALYVQNRRLVFSMYKKAILLSLCTKSPFCVLYLSTLADLANLDIVADFYPVLRGRAALPGETAVSLGQVADEVRDARHALMQVAVIGFEIGYRALGHSRFGRCARHGGRYTV